MVKITDRPNMTSAVYHKCNTLNQTNKQRFSRSQTLLKFFQLLAEKSFEIFINIFSQLELKYIEELQYQNTFRSSRKIQLLIPQQRETKHLDSFSFSPKNHV